MNLPKELKLSKIKYLAEPKEKNRWHEIDSLLCVDKKPSAEYIKKAKKSLLELQLVVYDIRI